MGTTRWTVDGRVPVSIKATRTSKNGAGKKMCSIERERMKKTTWPTLEWEGEFFHLHFPGFLQIFLSNINNKHSFLPWWMMINSIQNRFPPSLFRSGEAAYPIYPAQLTEWLSFSFEAKMSSSLLLWYVWKWSPIKVLLTWWTFNIHCTEQCQLSSRSGRLVIFSHGASNLEEFLLTICTLCSADIDNDTNYLIFY